MNGYEILLLSTLVPLPVVAESIQERGLPKVFLAKSIALEEANEH